MLKRFNLLAIFALSVITAQATTLSGTLKNPAGVGLTGVLSLAISQQAALISTGGCGGPAQIVPNSQVLITVTAGVLQSPPAIYGNDCMLPSNLYYIVNVTDAQGNTILQDRWIISGSSVNIGTIASAVVSGTTTTLGSSGFLLLTATANQTVSQPVGSSLSVNYFGVTNTLTFPDSTVCTAGGCTGASFSNFVTTNTPQTISGAKTFGSLVTANGVWPNGFIGPIFNANVSGLSGTNKTFQNSDGSYSVSYLGDILGQSITVTSGLTVYSTAGFSAPGGVTTMTTTQAISGLYNGVVTSHTPSGCSLTPFLSNTCKTFQNSDGSMGIDYLGNVAAQTFDANTFFISNSDLAGSPSTTYAFTDRTGNFGIYGDGHAGFQALTATSVTTNTVYNVGASAGITGSTCSAWTGGICTAP